MTTKTLPRSGSRGTSGSTGFPPLRCWALASTALLVVVLGVSSRQAYGQAAQDEEEIPPPQDLWLETPRDAVELAVTYYPPIEPGKDVVPVVLLHPYKGSRRDYVELAGALQRAGHAVVLPDLRGHGRSTTSARLPRPLDADRLRPDDFRQMVLDDMEAVNRFLWERNNEGVLNVNRLCLVGAEMGASIALLYAARDWSIADYGALQLGRFVKGLVLISPEWSFKGLPLQHAMRHPAIRNEISMLIAVGGRRPAAVRDAGRIHGMIRPHRPEPSRERAAEERDLFYAELDTALQGTDILGQGLKLEQFVAQFINLRLVRARGREFEWRERRRPHQ